MATFSERLADLANVTPVYDDPEDDLSDLTSARLAEKGNDNKLTGNERGQLRTKSAQLLSEDDSKYSGKKVSRKHLRDDASMSDIDILALQALQKKIDYSDGDDKEDGDDSDDDIDTDDDDEGEEDENKSDGNNDITDEDEEKEGDDDESMDDEDRELRMAQKLHKQNLQKAMRAFRISDDDDAKELIDDMNDDDDGDDDGDDDTAAMFKDSEELKAFKEFSKDLIEEEEDSKMKKKKVNTSKCSSDDDDDDDNEDESEDEDDAEQDDDTGDDKDKEMDIEKEHSKEKDKTGIQQFSSTAVNEEVQKGKAARNQLAIWDSLLESRIKLQKTVMGINQLPQPSIWQLLGGEEFDDLATEAQLELRSLLEKLVQLQTLLLLQNPATKKLVHKSDEPIPLNNNSKVCKMVGIEEDEEITSEEDETEDSKPTKPPPLPSTSLKRKIPLEEYPDFLAKRHSNFESFRNDTINKWNSKTQLVSGKIKNKGFSAFNQSVLKQIQQILSDKDRLIKRTQLKRSDYRVLGSIQEEKPEPSLAPGEIPEDRPAITSVNEYDEEIFDDSDFYHHMLREFIDRKSSEIQDPLALGRQWLEVQKSRTKVKRNVDMKASKGRKLRYNIHQKLVNFMAPVDKSSWTDDARDDLYKSLFGQKVKITENHDNR